MPQNRFGCRVATDAKENHKKQYENFHTLILSRVGSNSKQEVNLVARQLTQVPFLNLFPGSQGSEMVLCLSFYQSDSPQSFITHAMMMRKLMPMMI